MYRFAAKIGQFSKHAFRSLSRVRNCYHFKYLSLFPFVDMLPKPQIKDECSVRDPKIAIKNIHEEVEIAVLNGGKFLMDLIPILEEIIVEISKQYRECLVKQMELIEKAMELEVIAIRVQADELKSEIVRYENLVKSVAQSVYGQAALALVSGDNIDVLDVLQKRLRELEEIVEGEIVENQRYEHKLLSVNRENILQS